jgi:hypothetical protein
MLTVIMLSVAAYIKDWKKLFLECVTVCEVFRLEFNTNPARLIFMFAATTKKVFEKERFVPTKNQ